MDTWEQFKVYYKSLYPKTKLQVLDFIAVHEILELFCKGYSNKEISYRTDCDETYITDTLIEFLFTTGFSRDTGFDAREMYRRYKYNQYSYIVVCRQLDTTMSEDVYKLLFKANTTLDIIESEITNFYGRC